MIAETLKQLQAQGITLVETQVAKENVPAQVVLNELGFEQVNVGIVYRKKVTTETELAAETGENTEGHGE